MTRKDYYRAAHRHLETCKCLYATQKNTKLDKTLKSHYLSNIYYLSGYVVETMISYALFTQIRTELVNINNHPKFKTHNIQAKILYARKNNCSLDGILLIDKKSEKKIQKLYSDWTVDFRYQQYSNIRSIDEKVLFEYLNVLNSIVIEIIKRYPL